MNPQLSLEQEFSVEVRSHLLVSETFAKKVIDLIYFWLLEDTVVDLAPAKKLCFIQFSDGGYPYPKLLVDYGTMPALVCHAARLRSLDDLASIAKAIAAVTHIRIEGSDGIWEFRWDGPEKVLEFVGV